MRYVIYRSTNTMNFRTRREQTKRQQHQLSTLLQLLIFECRKLSRLHTHTQQSKNNNEIILFTT